MSTEKIGVAPQLVRQAYNHFEKSTVLVSRKFDEALQLN
jgi:hypothetical protein